MKYSLGISNFLEEISSLSDSIVSSISLHFCTSSHCNINTSFLFLKEKISHPGGGSVVAKSSMTLATPWTVARQAPLSMGFPSQEY